jgi:hypothetical protein
MAAGQHAALLPMDTACHGLLRGGGAFACFADGGVLVGRFHMNRSSTAARTRDQQLPDTFSRG